MEFRFLLLGLSVESRFMQAVAEDGEQATDEQSRGMLADL